MTTVEGAMRTGFGSNAMAATAVALLSTVMLASIALAAESTLTAELTGATEGDNPGDPDGSGSATITLDPAAGTLCWELTAENIGPVVQSHIHVGGEGESGGIAVPLDVDGFEGSSEGCIEPMEDAAVLQEILDDPAGYYVNLHTAEFQPGAIRGQLAAAGGQPNTAVTAPNGVSLVALAGAALLLMALGGFAARTQRGH